MVDAICANDVTNRSFTKCTLAQESFVLCFSKFSCSSSLPLTWLRMCTLTHLWGWNVAPKNSKNAWTTFAAKQSSTKSRKVEGVTGNCFCSLHIMQDASQRLVLREIRVIVVWKVNFANGMKQLLGNLSKPESLVCIGCNWLRKRRNHFSNFSPDLMS